MARRATLFLGLTLLVMPGFSEGPKPSDPQPEFYFTRLAYTDFAAAVRGAPMRARIFSETFEMALTASSASSGAGWSGRG
jgi:hypothetical protein